MLALLIGSLCGFGCHQLTTAPEYQVKNFRSKQMHVLSRIILSNLMKSRAVPPRLPVRLAAQNS